MDIERWKELTVVLQEKSMTAVAEKMGYTLSSISRSMMTLEKETGFQLLQRKKKGVEPTKECEEILPYVQDLLFAANRLEEKTALIRGGEEGEIRIGIAYRHYYRWLTEVTSEFHELHPGIQFRIYNGTSTEFAKKLEQHELDFCLISEREGEHLWKPICRDPLVALLPMEHALAKQEKILLDHFEREPYVATCPGLDIDSGRFFEKHKIVPNVQFSTMDIQATYAMVDAGMGISITNRINSLTQYEGICHRLLDPTEEIEIGLAASEGQTPSAELFWDYVVLRLPKEAKGGISKGDGNDSGE